MKKEIRMPLCFQSRASNASSTETTRHTIFLRQLCSECTTLCMAHHQRVHARVGIQKGFIHAKRLQQLQTRNRTTRTTSEAQRILQAAHILFLSTALLVNSRPCAWLINGYESGPEHRQAPFTPKITVRSGYTHVRKCQKNEWAVGMSRCKTTAVAVSALGTDTRKHQ